MRPSHHSIQRYQQRVDPGASVHSAARALADLAAHSTCRPRPRHWTPAAPSPGTTFLYPHARPDLCLIVRGGVVVTVIDRLSAKRWASQDRVLAASEGRTAPVAYRRPAPGAVDFHPDEAA